MNKEEQALAIKRIKNKWETAKRHALPTSTLSGLSDDPCVLDNRTSGQSFITSDLELQSILGLKWVKFKSDHKKLEDFRKMVTESKMIEAGIIPLSFTIWAHCKSCGDIRLDFDPGVPVVGCPWCGCANRPAFMH